MPLAGVAVRRPAAVAGMMLAVVATQARDDGPALAAGTPRLAHVVTPVVPAPLQAERGYTLRRGDTLSGVSRRLGISVTALAAVNGIADPNRVRAGQLLRLPVVGEPEPAPTPPPPPPPPPPAPPSTAPAVIVGGGRRHRVVRGENLARIAARYGTSVAELASLNELRNPNLVREGTDLEVPGPAWLCPVQGPSQFADSWGAPRPGGRRHLGVDMFAARGTPVVASVGGTLAHARGRVAGLAFYLRGDDRNTYYGAHLDTLEAPPGRVEQGARIGSVGSTGNAEGVTSHLHFEIKVDGVASVNPFPSVERWCRG